MVKLFLLLVLAAGAFTIYMVVAPQHATSTAFTAWGHMVPWFAIGVLLVVYLGYKKIAG